ncbi:MAG TPA: hypothetical protein VGC89_02060 [Pyrinomonadaceae bacterium]
MRKNLSLLVLIALFAQTLTLPAARAGILSGAAKVIQQTQAAVSALRNQDVLEMLKAGLSAEVVIAKINISSCDFDTSSAALQQLKAAGVPDAVVLAMLKAAGRAQGMDGQGKFDKSAANVMVKVPSATAIEIEAAHTISSSDVEHGSALSFRVVSPVKVNGVTVIAAGALATGRVVKAKKGGHWGRAGQLLWTMESVETVDGRLIPLQAESGGRRGVARKGEVATKTVATGILLIPLFPLAPLALLHGYKRGDDAVLSEGARYTVFVRGEVSVNGILER